LISVESSGSFKNLEAFLQKSVKLNLRSIVEPYAQMGVNALETATPSDSGLAANSWSYTIEESGGKLSISWNNNDIESGFPVAIMLQYGHGTGTGGYVRGRDYINPALKPIFDKISEAVWKAVISV